MPAPNFGYFSSGVTAAARAWFEPRRSGLALRDLKPSNGLGGQDEPQMIDFGIPRPTEASTGTHETDTCSGSMHWETERSAANSHLPHQCI
jgi:serine/threonine protein kinase